MTARIEGFVGNVFAAILILIVILSICYSAFTWLFRDGRGMSPYGSRGEFYLSE